MLEFCFIDADYIIEKFNEEEKPVIRLFGKTKDGKSILVLDKNFEPYFYAVPKDLEKAKKKIEKTGGVKRVEIVEKIVGHKKKKVLKVIGFLPPEIPKLRDVVKKMKEVGKENCYEYAVSFYKRYLIDKGFDPLDWVKVKGKEIKKDFLFDLIVEAEEIKKSEKRYSPDFNILAFDIESYEEAGKNKIVMLSMFSKGWKKVLTYQKDSFPKFVEVVKDEKELIEKFMKIVEDQDPDFLITYNGDMFDFQILRDRVEEYKMHLILSRDKRRMTFARRARTSSARVEGRVHIDLYNFINNILSPQMQTEVLTLNAVAAELLGEEKIEMQLEEILEAWRKKKDLIKLAEYCAKDSELTYKLAEILIPQIFELSKVSGQLPFDCSRMTYGQLVEWFLMKKAYPKYIAPDRPKWDDIKKRREFTPYKGGFVREPIPGIHENISVLDFKSLYPSIIVTYNIDPGTLNCPHKKNAYKVPDFNRWFCKKEKGFIPALVEELINERNDVKKKMKKLKKGSQEYRNLDNRQYALKIMANATYGYYGYSGARWYSRECAESTSSFGRHWIKKVMQEAEKDGFTVIYGDTDSLMIKEKKAHNFLKKIDKMLPGIMELELEGEFKRGIFVSRATGQGAKKRYALIDNKGNLTIRGFEVVRRDWCELAKRVQRDVLRYILEKNDRNGAVDYAREIIKKIKKKKVDLKDLLIYTQVTKPLSEYKQIGPHVVVAKKMKERGRPVGPGMIVMFVITQGKGSISQRAEPFEDVTINQIDTEYYINNQIVSVAMRVLQVLGVDEEELLGEGKQKTLEKFGGRK